MSYVLAVVAFLLTGYFLTDWLQTYHICLCGLPVALLVAIIVWGIVENQTREKKPQIYLVMDKDK